MYSGDRILGGGFVRRPASPYRPALSHRAAA
jgi:hypothetical protein